MSEAQTPRTDAHSLDMETEDFDVELAKTYELAWQLERELNAAKSAISGRTVSCSNCNALAVENAELQTKVHSLEFRLSQEKHINNDHEQDYLAVWKLIKRPDETVVQAAKRLNAENAAMREVIKEAYAALDGCQEDTCELIAERDWWKTEPRCGYSARWAEMNVRYAKAAAALSKLQPYLK